MSETFLFTLAAKKKTLTPLNFDLKILSEKFKLITHLCAKLIIIH